jgi:hypothetical protein
VVRLRRLRERSRAARPMLAGRPHEAVSNGSPRWMAAGPRERVHRTRPTGQLARRPTWKYVASPGHDTVPGGGRRRPRGQPASRCSAAGTGVLARSSWGAESARLDACLRVSGGGFGRLPSGAWRWFRTPDSTVNPTAELHAGPVPPAVAVGLQQHQADRQRPRRARRSRYAGVIQALPRLGLGLAYLRVRSVRRTSWRSPSQDTMDLVKGSRSGRWITPAEDPGGVRHDDSLLDCYVRLPVSSRFRRSCRPL